MTYIFTLLAVDMQFQAANVGSTVLSFLSLCLHLAYALKPTDEDDDDDEEDKGKKKD
jgi:hypothetical protein